MAKTNSLFEQYKKNKAKLKFDFKGYAIENIVSMDLISEVYLNPSLKLKTLRYFFLAYKFDSLKENKSTNTLFSIGKYPRKDYYEILNYARASVSDSILFDYNTIKPETSFQLSNVFFALRHVFKQTDLSIKSKLFLACQLSFYLNTISNLEKIELENLKYCSFSSVHQLEAILTFYFQKRNIPTFSLQHGVYYIFKEQIPLDAIVYENFISGKHLCWGQYSADQLMEYGVRKESLFVAGYPRNYTRTKVPSSLNSKKCVVLLARHSYEHSNMSLIAILKAFKEVNNVDIHLKLHPSLKRESYENICKLNGWSLVANESTLTDIFKLGIYGWAIAVNTAAYYEAYLNYLPCLRFNDGTFEDSLNVNDDQFLDLKKLVNNYNNIPFQKEKDLKEYFTLSDEKLKYIIGLNINNYSTLEV